MDQLPKKIETKTTPFALPKSTTNSIQNKNIKKLKYSPRGDSNFFYILIVIFLVVATGAIIYVLLSLSQLQKISNVQNLVNTNTNTTVVEVGDTETITQPIWSDREVKINNNVVWDLQLPSSFIETNTNTSDGISVFTGDDSGYLYKLKLEFPLFTNYPNGEPESLKEWVKQELAFLSPEESLTITSESFTVNENVDATLLINMREVTADSGNARIFGTKKSLVLYIAKTKNRNFSKITLVPQDIYNDQSARALIERIASTLKF